MLDLAEEVRVNVIEALELVGGQVEAGQSREQELVRKFKLKGEMRLG